MTRKNLAHTDGVSGEGTPHGKRRWRECDDALGTEVVIRYTKRPKVVEDYFDCAKVTDIASHMRQGGLALEQVEDPEVGASFIFNSSWVDRDRCILCMETFSSRRTCRFH